MLNDSDLIVLNAAQAILKRLESAAMLNAYDATATDRPRPVDYGRLAEAADRASAAIFNAKNVASSYCNVHLAYEQLHGKPEPVAVES